MEDGLNEFEREKTEIVPWLLSFGGIVVFTRHMITRRMNEHAISALSTIKRPFAHELIMSESIEP